jgi:two-component system, NtrC family, sensor histidine kinase HydH
VAGENAEIAVIDRGAGIDARLMDTIFNPFFTTKPDGVGLGLAIVAKIVDQHGGKITVESEQGKGSIFRVFLPMEGAPSASKPKD